MKNFITAFKRLAGFVPPPGMYQTIDQQTKILKRLKKADIRLIINRSIRPKKGETNDSKQQRPAS